MVEAEGIVLIGENVTHVRSGDRVLLSPHYCGEW